jgi:hypothetical protein
MHVLSGKPLWATYILEQLRMLMRPELDIGGNLRGGNIQAVCVAAKMCAVACVRRKPCTHHACMKPISFKTWVDVLEKGCKSLAHTQHEARKRNNPTFRIGITMAELASRFLEISNFEQTLYFQVIWPLLPPIFLIMKFGVKSWIYLAFGFWIRSACI